MSGSLKLNGLKDLNKRLEKLGGKVSNKVSRDAVREGAKVIRKEMRARAPRKTGELRRNIRYRIRGRKGNFHAKVGLSRKIYYGWFIEYGTQEHLIPSPTVGRGRNKRKNTRKLKINGVVISRVMHPGIRQRPFMRPAWDSSKRKTFDSIKTALWKRTREETSRL